ncbi:mitochondrial carrier protein, putative [Bodo saltans]|uniref:Mitochondrial carrier protein, putative n=1 Tax=Bodo saltans TaxID=75058 RepID=A0A0S4J7P1_BODSA|nr:mitochondrial carrier protein, putative [Bodo saltans]|eukprot:CUG86005.1 mitochondrial carrier protein, putative [Bodo saltans]
MSSSSSSISPPPSYSPRSIDHMLSGACAGIIAGGATHPLDVIRLRQQLRAGWQWRYPGLCAALMKEAIFSAGRIGFYQMCTGGDQRRSFARGDSAIRFAAGGAAGVVGTVLSHPLELMKVVKVASPSNPSYIRIFRNLFRQQDLFRALLPAVQRSVVFSAAQLGSYDVCKRKVRAMDPELDYRYAVLLSAWLAGIASTILSTPLDVAKTRLIVSDFRGTYDCLRCIAQYEGVRYLWKGATATWLRLGPYTLVQMLVWEASLESIRRQRTSSV